LGQLTRLRELAATAAAMATGVVRTVTHRSEPLAELKPGDQAPDFTLPGSDGRTYRLSDLAGHPVVLAWFPKAFTGG
jgi:peroxiredoxin Q/BCP